MTELAIFDLDYTLTKRGTWGRFVALCAKDRPWVWPGLLLRAGWTQWQYKRGTLPRIAVKTAMMKRVMVGRTREDLERLADAFVQDDLKDGMRDPVMHALKQHQTSGHKVLIASAAVDLLASRYASALDVDGEVSTIMAWTDDDRLADHYASDNCYGEQKMVRIREWLDKHKIRPEHVTSYSDSRADAPMLEFADKAIVVKPNRKTRRYAELKKFEIW